ncbi:MAG: deoxyribonuclease V [Patescibacteria group bacterium]
MWNVTPKEAIEIQKDLRAKVNIVPYNKPIRLIGGADVSMNMFAKDGYAGFVVLDYENLEMIDHAVVKDVIGFPYIPGLLSFREIPMLLKAWKELKTKPDVLVVDGVGIAHPRRLGIAVHLGLELGIPTIGCAKSVLTGEYEEPGNNFGDFSYMHDKYTGEVIGAALRTKKNVKPVFISPGNMITLDESIEIIKHCVKKHRLPEPTRFAHNTMNEYRIKG